MSEHRGQGIAAIPRPPALDDVVREARPIDHARFLWWNERGYLHGARHGRGLGRLASLVLAVFWWPALPVTVPIMLILAGSPRARYYMSPERDAVLKVVATRRGWRIEDHATARPGTGRGAALRAVVIPRLIDAADADQVTVKGTAATAALADRYKAEVPGLVDVGRGCPRGRQLRRPPSKSAT